ncbi:metacaspase type ii [Moniliophthora roreri]|uniref:Peptidase C14 caspase domain-containing protein n=1 Tax=Moniliophthora roreri TaxID=221103 RepID=A0A0W0F8E4_MONRR|nr:metacaspase type ii [Moniliophthora roreri]
MAMCKGQDNIKEYHLSAPDDGKIAMLPAQSAQHVLKRVPPGYAAPSPPNNFEISKASKRPVGLNTLRQRSQRLWIIGKWLQPTRPPIVGSNLIDAMKPKPKKRALLIGITSSLTTQQPDQVAGGEERILKGPHTDVAVMKNLLIEKYAYDPSDITTLLDNNDPKQKQPTRDSVMAEMQNLIKNAVAGDRLFLHYAGHTIQVPSKGKEEEDGMDECLVPCDSTTEDDDDKLIKDDVLRSILVDKLPVGCQLFAIFDSCHSASLLDLQHSRCNRVYVPWISKGRRLSKSMWNTIVRQQAALVNVYQTKRTSNTAVKTCKTSQGVLNGPSNIPPLPAMPALHPTDSATGTTSLPPISLNTKPWFEGGIVSGTCESPIREVCDGFCRELPPTTPAARCWSTSGNGKDQVSRFRDKPEYGDVVSLSSCKDSQRAWEDSTGLSMTQCLVEILSQDPHPTYNNLMFKLNHAMHDHLLHIHGETKTYKKKMVRWRQKINRKRSQNGDTKGGEMTNFQDPQLSSQRPLDMNKKLIL